MNEWTLVCRDKSSATSRMSVPGGWLYRVRTWGGNSVAVSICFVPYVAEIPA